MSKTTPDQEARFKRLLRIKAAIQEGVYETPKKHQMTIDEMVKYFKTG